MFKKLIKIVSFLGHMFQKKNDLDIVLHLLKKEGHVREIAKALNESVSTTARRLENLKNNNIVDYNQEGKNKVFYLKKNLLTKTFILQAEQYKKAKLLHKHPKLITIIEEILKITNKELIILFGSYAKGLEKQGSDIDIYIETNNKDIKEKIENIHSTINVKIGLFNKDSPLIKEIIQNHIILRGVEVFYDKKPVSL